MAQTFFWYYRQFRAWNLDIFSLKDESLEGSGNLSDPDIIAAEWSEWDERHRR